MVFVHQIIVVHQAEMEVVKTGMQHGDLSLDAYTQVPTAFLFPLINHPEP